MEKNQTPRKGRPRVDEALRKRNRPLYLTDEQHDTLQALAKRAGQTGISPYIIKQLDL